MLNDLVTQLGKNRVRKDVDLFPYLSMRLHTTAQYFFEAQSKEDIIHAVAATRELNLPFMMLGGGSNTVFNRAEIEGLVMKNNYSSIEIGSENDTFTDVIVGSGTNMAVLIQSLVEKGLSGLEYHKGLPGTVGGAVYMNSKWTHPLAFVGDTVVEAELFNADGTVKKVKKDYFQFAYDYSKLQDTHEFLLSVTFRLRKKTSQEVSAQANESFAYRKKTQPQGSATCGCFFQNITEEQQKRLKLITKSAGHLIDSAGMKGARVGSFVVSPVHANFIINEGGDARPGDLKTLVKNIKERVKAKFGVELREEVKIF